MIEHDGLTAEQEAKRRWPTATPWAPTPAQGQNAMHFAFISGAEWATEREKARAEAAEARVSELERFAALEAELNRARAKFPGHDHLLAALVEEVGETAQAYLKGRPSDARAEALQVACVAMRIVEEGDLEFERADYVSTEPSAPTTEAETEVEGS